MPDYFYDMDLVVDPLNPSNVVAMGSVAIYDPADTAGTTLLALKDPSGLPLPNPLTSNANGFLPPRIASVPQTLWKSGGFEGYFNSFKGLRDEAVLAVAAAQGAADAATTAVAEVVTTAAVDGAGALVLTKASGATVNAGNVRGPQGVKGDKGLDGANVLPTDTAIQQAITTPGTATATALSATYAQAQPMVPVAPASAISIQSPYDISGSGVHPDVVDAGAGKWNGWRYWMVYTPYWRSAARYENPVILASNDGHNWVEPAGITNPIDPDPAGTPINSDPDMVLVSGTMYVYYRQHDATSNTEQIMLRTSTDGVTWSAETTVIDTTGLGYTDRDNIISPGVVHTGSQFVMFYTNSGLLKRRTSTNGTTWSAEAACTGTIPASSHVDAIYSGGRYHLLLQTVGDTGLNQSGQGARTIVLAKSNDGVAFTVGATPLLVSEHMGQRQIYRTCGLLETRNGKDYYKLWVSCVSYGLATTAAGVQAEEASNGAESYYIGYTEGYDPNDVANNDRTSLYPAGDVIAGGQVRAKRMGAFSIWGRFIVGVRGMFDVLSAQELRGGVAYMDGGNYEQSVSNMPKWATKLGYTSGNIMPSLVIGSRSDTTVSSATLAFHNTSPGNARAVGEGWQVSVNEFGHLMFHQRAANGTLTRRGYFDYATGDLIMDRNVTTAVNVNAANVISGASGGLIASGAFVRITTATTPANGADSVGTVGDVRRDDNYVYVKTSTGWKRSALTTW